MNGETIDGFYTLVFCIKLTSQVLNINSYCLINKAIKHLFLLPRLYKIDLSDKDGAFEVFFFFYVKVLINELLLKL